MLNNLFRIYTILPSSFRRRSLVILFLLAVNSVFDLIGLGAIIPLFSIVVNSKSFLSAGVIADFYSFLGFTSPKIFIIFICVLVFFIILLKNFLSILILRNQYKFTFGLFSNLNYKLMDNVYRKGYSHINDTNTHYIIRDFYTVPFQFCQKLIIPILVLFNEIVVSLALLITILIFDYKIFFFLVCIVGPIFILFYNLSKKKVLKINKDLNNLSPILWDNFFDLIHGYVDVMVYNVKLFFFNRSKENISTFTKMQITKNTIDILPVKITESSLILGVIIIIIYGVFTYDDSERLLILLGMFSLAAFRMLPSINRIMIATLDLRGNLFTIPILEQGLNITRDMVSENPIEIKFQKAIVVKDLCFSYGEKQILNNINLKIVKGETIGLIGESGSGKSTLINLILGFLKPKSGEILIDKVLLNEDSIESWRKSLGYVKQDIYLSDDTLRNNIAFGQTEINLECLDKAIKLSKLNELVESNTEGLNLKIGEKGSQLSGGQRQRVGIARALYAGAEIIIFDEATSALDYKTENEVTESINNLKAENLTMIIIAHRYSTLKYCDRIFELENGNIKRELLYKDLENRQTNN